MNDRLLERIAERVARENRSIQPERVYSREEAAELIGVGRAKTLADIPPELLPTTRVTPGGRTVGYYGRDLIRYIRHCRDENAPPLDGAA